MSFHIGGDWNDHIPHIAQGKYYCSQAKSRIPVPGPLDGEIISTGEKGRRLDLPFFHFFLFLPPLPFADSFFTIFGAIMLTEDFETNGSAES